MVFRPAVTAVICVGLFLIFESFMVPKTMALGTHNGFRMEDQSTHRRRNYMWQRARDKVILMSLEKKGMSYKLRRDIPDAIDNTPEDPSYAMDYGNILNLDKSLETTAREKKHHDQAIQDPGKCEHSEERLNFDIDGVEIFPKYVTEKFCSVTNSCPRTYECKNILYEIQLLRKKNSDDDDLIIDKLKLIPNNLSLSWVTQPQNISVGCQCTKMYKVQRF